MRFVQHLRTTNDRNGNPRRLFATYDELGHVVSIEDEGYGGRPESLRNGSVVELPSIAISPAEYRNWIEYGKKLGR